MTRELTCIVCPLGCKIEVTFSDAEAGKIESITGNTCRRGEEYAIAECTHPVRTLTSTVLCEDGSVVAVKTNGPIPKEAIFDCMKAVNLCRAPLPVHIGDVLIENICDTGVDLIATANRAATPADA